MMELILMLCIYIGVYYYVTNHLGIDRAEINTMWVGILAWNSISILSKLVVGIFSGIAFSSFFLLLFILAVNLGIGYWCLSNSTL